MSGFAPLTAARPPYTQADLEFKVPQEGPPRAMPYDGGASPFVNRYTRPLPGYAETFSGPGYFSARQKTSGWCVAAVICGITGVFLAVPALGAVLCGHLGLYRTRDNERLGRGLAVAGLVLGYAIAAVYGLLIAAIWLTDL